MIEYNQIHDNKSTGCNGAHIDALDLNVTNGIIRGNRIWWCGTQCIFSGDPGSMLIENNMIEETNACGSGCDGPQELAVMGTVTFRYNTIEGDDGYGRDPDRPGNAEVYGNIFLSNHGAGCGGSGAVKTNFHDNVFAPGSGACGIECEVLHAEAGEHRQPLDERRPAGRLPPRRQRHLRHRRRRLGQRRPATTSTTRLARRAAQSTPARTSADRQQTTKAKSEAPARAGASPRAGTQKPARRSLSHTET